MIISNCCNDKIEIKYGGEGTSFYYCKKCDNACDTKCSINFDVELNENDRIEH